MTERHPIGALAQCGGMGRTGDTDVAALVQAGQVTAVIAACTAVDADALALQRADIVATCAPIHAHGWWSDKGSSAEQHEAASVAMCAVATVAEHRSARWSRTPRDLDATHRILVRRDQAFRDAWVEQAVEALDGRGLRVARRLVHDGVAAKPVTDAYTIALVAQPSAFDLRFPLADARVPRRLTVLDTLRANPDLLVDDVWRVFEVEGGGQNSLAAHDKYTHVDAGWQRALVALAADGTLDRGRLLDASLDALQRGFAPFRAQWHSAFHEALAPTADERLARASTYLALTASPVGPTVAMALKALTLVQQAGGLDPVEVEAAIGPALLAPAKGSATKAVALLAKAGDASDPAGAGPVMVEALGHPAKEVQASALKQLRRWSPDGPEPDLADRVRALAGGCHVSVRADIDAWVGDEPRHVGVSSAAPAAAPAVRHIDVTTVDWLAPDRALVPISDPDDLHERASAAMEHPGDPEELERVLAALGGCDPAELARDGRAKTLAKRAAKLQANAERCAQAYVAACIVARFAPDAWVEPRPRPGARTPGAVVLDELLERRLDALAVALRARTPVGVLATPTHRGGWIDPVVLVDRLLGWPAEEPPDPADVTAALLRVAPGAARIGEALQLAGRSRKIPKDVRTCLAGWPEWCRRDADRVSGWSCTSETHRVGNESFTHHELHVAGADDVITPTGAPLAVRLQSSRWGALSGRYSHDPVALRWVGSLVPGLPGRWACAGADAIGATSGTREVQHGDPGVFEAFFDADVPLGGDAHLLVALGTNDPRPAVHSVAVDLAIAAAAEARLDPARLGGEIGRLASTGVVTPARWGRTLRSIAEAGSHHRVLVRLVLEEAVAVMEPRKPQDVLALLEALETVLLEDGVSLTRVDARAKLEAMVGSSKTGKTASRLLARAAG
jgi:hypothetical protein